MEGQVMSSCLFMIPGTLLLLFFSLGVGGVETLIVETSEH